MKSLYEQLGGTYHQEGDYLIPNIGVPELPEHIPLGKYGRMRRQYLMEHRFDSSRYMDIIYRKTGALMTACCELGDASLRQYGVCFGTAFQVRDDLMDYGTDDTAMLPAKEVLESELQRLVNEAVGCLGKQPATKYTEALRHLALNLLDTSC